MARDDAGSLSPWFIGTYHAETMECGDATLSKAIALAVRVTGDAFELTHSARTRRPVALKSDNTPVTAADHAIQAHAVAMIRGAFPDHAILAEEDSGDGGGPSPTEARYCWVIDPIDGTRNFVSGFACFATSIALLDRGVPVVGVVGEHNLRHVYSAATDQGATLNGEPIRACDPVGNEDAIVGVPSSKEPLTQRVVARWLATPGLILRNLGSTAMHLSMIASGAMNGAFCKRCKIWDLAAGVALVREAGGAITAASGLDLLPFDLSRDPLDDVPFVAGAGRTHDRLLRSIAT